MKYIDFHKGMIKPVLKIIAFLLVLACVLEALSLTIFSKGAAATYSNKYTNAYSYLAEPENTIEIAGIANSNLYSAFVPSVLWKKDGYTSTLICAPRQTLSQSYEYAQKIFETQTPKLLILETDMFYREEPVRGEGEERFATEKPLDIFFDYMDPEIENDMMKSVWPIFNFHDRWKALLKGNSGKVEDPNSHGYHLSLKVIQFDPGDYMRPTDESEKMKTADVETLKAIMRFCNEKGCKVLWLSVPSPKFWSYPRHNYVSSLADELGVEFIDYNLMWEELNLDSQTDFRDIGNHLNYDGAKKLTAYFAKTVKGKYGLTDYRGDPDYSSWDESAKRFEKDVKKLRKKEEKKKK